MSQKQDLLTLFRANGNQLTLGQILNTLLAAEYRARITDLRHEGYVIVCQRGKIPSENVYRLLDPDMAPRYDNSGQAVFF